MRRLTMLVVAASAVGLMLAPAARADWNLGDPYKMHYPQLPDLNGWDVRLTDPPPTQTRILADDWKCSETGLVTDVHFWGSWFNDLVGTINWIHAIVYADNPNPGSTWSQPLAPGIADALILPNQFKARLWGTGNQGWYDPTAQQFIVNNHQNIYQYNITGLDLVIPGTTQPFIQQKDQIYWLGLEVNVAEQDRTFGWKTSGSPHFLDDAVYNVPPGQWVPLNDPITGSSLDLAFVITPEPATLGLVALGLLAGLRRKRGN